MDDYDGIVAHRRDALNLQKESINQWLSGSEHDKGAGRTHQTPAFEPEIEVVPVPHVADDDVVEPKLAAHPGGQGRSQLPYPSQCKQRERTR